MQKAQVHSPTWWTEFRLADKLARSLNVLYCSDMWAWGLSKTTIMHLIVGCSGVPEGSMEGSVCRSCALFHMRCPVSFCSAASDSILPFIDQYIVRLEDS